MLPRKQNGGSFVENGSQMELTFELCTLGNLMFRRMGEHMRENGMADVTVMHATIIIYLFEHEETFQRDLENAFQVNRSTITKIVQAMESRGYIRRETVPCDRRLKRLALTDLGRSLYGQLLRCNEITNQELLDALPREEGAALIQSMRTIREKLE